MLRRDFLRFSVFLAALSGLPSRSFGAEKFRVDPRLGHRIGGLEYSFKNGVAEFDRSVLTRHLPRLAGGATYFVDPARGNNDEDGLAWDSSLRTVSEALRKADVGRVVVRGGFIYRIDETGNEGLGVYIGSRDVSIVSHGGMAIFSTARVAKWSRSWFRSNGDVSISSPTGGRIVRVVDTSRLDSYGEYENVKQVDSIEECKSKPDTWFYEKGRVHLNRENVPGDEILLLRSSAQGVSAKNVRVHFNGIHFVGGSNGAFSDFGSEGSLLFFENCKFTHNWQSDGLKINDSYLTISVNCVAAQNAKDGFNYHKGVHTSPHFIEVGCLAYANHAPATGNGSSSHDQCVGIRINSSYHNNSGPGVADVNDARTYNISCASRENGPGGNSSGFLASSDGKNGTGAMMWLDHCSAGGNSGRDVYAGSGAVINYRSLEIDDDEIFADSSSVLAAFG